MCFVLQSKKPSLLAQGGDPLLLASTTRTTTSCACLETSGCASVVQPRLETGWLIDGGQLLQEDTKRQVVVEKVDT